MSRKHFISTTVSSSSMSPSTLPQALAMSHHMSPRFPPDFTDNYGEVTNFYLNPKSFLLLWDRESPISHAQGVSEPQEQPLIRKMTTDRPRVRGPESSHSEACSARFCKDLTRTDLQLPTESSHFINAPFPGSPPPPLFSPSHSPFSHTCAFWDHLPSKTVSPLPLCL